VTASTAPLRRCSKCNELKPLAGYRSDSRGYRRSHCIACCLIDSQEWRARHHADLLARRRSARKAVGREEATDDSERDETTTVRQIGSATLGSLGRRPPGGGYIRQHASSQTAISKITRADKSGGFISPTATREVS
jgi:hypothetical protein